jgi:hypothetical protein
MWNLSGDDRRPRFEWGWDLSDDEPPPFEWIEGNSIFDKGSPPYDPGDLVWFLTPAEHAVRVNLATVMEEPEYFGGYWHVVTGYGDGVVRGDAWGAQSGKGANILPRDDPLLEVMFETRGDGFLIHHGGQGDRIHAGRGV